MLVETKRKNPLNAKCCIFHSHIHQHYRILSTYCQNVASTSTTTTRYSVKSCFYLIPLNLLAHFFLAQATRCSETKLIYLLRDYVCAKKNLSQLFRILSWAACFGSLFFLDMIFSSVLFSALSVQIFSFSVHFSALSVHFFFSLIRWKAKSYWNSLYGIQ